MSKAITLSEILNQYAVARDSDTIISKTAEDVDAVVTPGSSVNSGAAAPTEKEPAKDPGAEVEKVEEKKAPEAPEDTAAALIQLAKTAAQVEKEELVKEAQLFGKAFAAAVIEELDKVAEEQEQSMLLMKTAEEAYATAYAELVPETDIMKLASNDEVAALIDKIASESYDVASDALLSHVFDKIAAEAYQEATAALNPAAEQAAAEQAAAEQAAAEQAAAEQAAAEQAAAEQAAAEQAAAEQAAAEQAAAEQAAAEQAAAAAEVPTDEAGAPTPEYVAELEEKLQKAEESTDALKDALVSVTKVAYLTATNALGGK